MATLTINGQIYNEASETQINALGSKIFSANDGMKEGDKITFDAKVKPMHTSGKIGDTNREWLVFPCKVKRDSNGTEFDGVISVSTLTGSAYTNVNPESGTQKNEPFNRFAVDAITGKTDGKDKISALLSALAGKSFTIRRSTFHNPKEFVPVMENGKEVLKADGSKRMTPKTSVIGDKLVILTNPRTVSQLV